MTEKVLYQHGTLGCANGGLMDGTTSIAEVLKYGTLGLGTLHGLDGEVIFLDGEAYQGRSDGALIHLSGEESTLCGNHCIFSGSSICSQTSI